LGLHPAVVALVRKDWTVRRRDLVLFARALLPVFFLAIFFLRNASGALGTLRSLGPGPAGALLAVAPATLLLLAISSELGLSAIGLEGGAIWIWAVSPNSMRRLLLAKCLAAAIPTAIIAALMGTVLEVVTAPGLGWSIGAVLLLSLTCACLAVVLVCLGGVSPRFDWTDARRIVRPAIAYAALPCEVLVFGVAAALAGIPVAMARFFGLPPLPWFLLGLGLGVLGPAVVAGMAVPIALARLGRLEAGAALREQQA
jgi:hypothetical protein